MNRNEILAYGALGVSFVLMMVAGQFAPLAVLSILFAGLSYLFYSWGNVYVPLLTRNKRNIKVAYGTELTPAEDAVLKKVGEDYVATVFLNLDVYETMTNKTDEEMHDYARYFERTISSLKDPVKICAMLYERDMSKYIKDIESKKAEVESRIAAERKKKDVDERKVEILEREKVMWERRLESIYNSERKPQAVAYFVAVSGRGPTKESAVSAAKIKAREVKATFSGGMSLNVDELTHRRMKACYEWEFLSPER